MGISMQKLLQKMEEEIRNAIISASETRIRERIQAIKTLCELILEEPEEKQHQFTAITTVPSQAVTINNSERVVNNRKRLESDVDANGESLFDF